MKVANIFFEDRYGGPQKRAIQVAREIKGKGVSTVIVLPEGDGNAPEVAEREGVTTVRIPFCRIPRLSRFFRVIRWMLLLPADIHRFAKYFRDEAPDLVHVNGAFFVAPAFAARIKRIPFVWHLNDTIVPKKMACMLGWLVKNLASETVVAAQAVARHYNIPTGKYTVIFAPVDVDKIRKVERNHDLEGPVRIGLLANWSPIKGVEYYVQAAGLLRDKIERPLQVVFAGQRMSNVEYCEEIERLVDSVGLRPKIVDLGYVSDSSDLLRRIDILVMSSISEACPMSVLEAMATGIPVVASDVGGVRELLLDGEREAGIIVAAKNADAIADAMLKIAQSPDLGKRMGDNGRLFAESRFSLDVCADRHVEVYRRACRKHEEGGSW